MALEISVRNSRLFKKPLSISEIIGNDNWSYGTLDEHARLAKGSLESGGPLIIYDNDCICRGIQVIGADSSKEIHLALNLPAADRDVKMIFELAAKIARLWQSNHILIEGDKTDLSETEASMEFNRKANLSLLRNSRELFNAQEYVTIFGAMLPICIPIDQLESFGDEAESFGKYLHERQRHEAYLSVALFGQIEGIFSSVYVAFADGHIILPYEPDLRFTNQGQEHICRKSYVMVPDLFPGEKSSRMEYNDFIAGIPSEKKSEFDHKHFLLSPLTKEGLQQIFRK